MLSLVSFCTFRWALPLHSFHCISCMCMWQISFLNLEYWTSWRAVSSSRKSSQEWRPRSWARRWRSPLGATRPTRGPWPPTGRCTTMMKTSSRQTRTSRLQAKDLCVFWGLLGNPESGSGFPSESRSGEGVWSYHRMPREDRRWTQVMNKDLLVNLVMSCCFSSFTKKVKKTLCLTYTRTYDVCMPCYARLILFIQ